MAFNGSGTFVRIYSWATDAANNVKISSSRMDTEDNGFATGLSTAICRDGQSTISADIPFNTKKITGLGNATADADALNRVTADGRYPLTAGGTVTFPGSTAILVAPLINSVASLTDGATVTLNAALGGEFNLIAAGDRTITVPLNPTAGQKIIIRHKASGANRTLALATTAGGFRFGSDISSLSATVSGKTDYIGCVYNGDDAFFDVVAVVKGY